MHQKGRGPKGGTRQVVLEEVGRNIKRERGRRGQKERSGTKEAGNQDAWQARRGCGRVVRHGYESHNGYKESWYGEVEGCGQ